MDGMNSPCLGFDTIGTNCEPNVLNLGAAPLTFGECKFGSCCQKLVEYMSDLGQVFLKGAASHKNVIQIVEVTASSNVVEKDVELCW